MGGDAVEVLAARHDAVFRRAPRFIGAQVAEIDVGGPSLLALPNSFMNESGRPVGALARYYHLAAEHLLVVHDDIDLPFLKLRVQFGRSPGGHNGVDSVVRSLGTRDFWRLKIGVGRPPGSQDPADFVLRRFSAKERPEIDVAIQHAADVVSIYLSEGADAARQRAGELGGAG